MNLCIKLILVSIFTSFLTCPSYAGIGGYISTSDKKRFVEILAESFKIQGDDTSSVYYGVRGYKLLGEPYDKSTASQICEKVKKDFKLAENLEAAYNWMNTWSLLNCPGKLQTEANIKDLQTVLGNGKSPAANIHYALEILTLLKVAIPNGAKIAQLLKAKLKEDDSLVSLGHTLHAASLLGDAGKFALDHVEDVVVQADEIDGKLLQWEGGLSVTSILITGLFKLPNASPFTSQQAEKIANYLLTRTTVQTWKGIVALLEAAQALASSKVSPVSIGILGNGQVTADKPELTIQISNILGEPLKSTASPVVAQSVKKIPGNIEVLSKQTLIPGLNSVQFILSLKVEPGNYNIEMLAHGDKATLKAKVLGPVTINSLEIGLNDADGSSAPKMSKLSYPGKLSSKLQADSSQQLVVKFSLSRPVHQAFLRLYSEKKEIIFVAEQDTSKVYKVEINLASELGQSGTFESELILGDAIITNPIRWVLGMIDVNLGISQTSITPKILRGPKPEIRHLFKQPEKRPPHWMPTLFLILTAVPFLMVLISWGSMGIKVQLFRPSTLLFHIAFLLVFLLYYKFWFELDMFTTCAYLVPVGTVLFLVGYNMLSSIARNREPNKKADK